MCDFIKGPNGLQSCRPTTWHSRLPSRDLKSCPDYLDIRQSPECRQYPVREIATSTLQAGSLRAPRHQQDRRSYGRPSKESRVQPEHLGPQSDASTYRALASKLPQGSHLQASENNASSLMSLQGLYISPVQKAHWYPGSCKPCWNDEAEDQLSTRGPGQGNAAFSPRAVNIMDVQPNGAEPPCAPRMVTIPLPSKQEADQHHLACNGPALGGSWLTSTSGSGPKPLGRLDLDVSLPVPFTW